MLDYAPNWGIPLELRKFTIEELLQADEVLLFSSSKHPMPIVRVEDHIIGDGKVGNMAKKIFDLYEAELAQVCGPRPGK